MLIGNLKDVGKLIKAIRITKKYSGPYLSSKAAIGQAMLSRIETGKTNLTISTLMKIARAFGRRLYISIR